MENKGYLCRSSKDEQLNLIPDYGAVSDGQERMDESSFCALGKIFQKTRKTLVFLDDIYDFVKAAHSIPKVLHI